jgi:hypothetical protein
MKIKISFSFDDKWLRFMSLKKESTFGFELETLKASRKAVLEHKTLAERGIQNG